MPTLQIGASNSYIGEAWVGAPGIQTVVFESTGYINFSGTVEAVRALNKTTSGSIVFSGIAETVFIGVQQYEFNSTGGIVFSATVDKSVHKHLTAVGSIRFNGDSSFSRLESRFSLGSILFGGTAAYLGRDTRASVWQKSPTKYPVTTDGVSNVWVDKDSVGGASVVGGGSNSVWK